MVAGLVTIPCPLPTLADNVNQDVERMNSWGPVLSWLASLMDRLNSVGDGLFLFTCSKGPLAVFCRVSNESAHINDGYGIYEYI